MHFTFKCFLKFTTTQLHSLKINNVKMINKNDPILEFEILLLNPYKQMLIKN